MADPAVAVKVVELDAGMETRSSLVAALRAQMGADLDDDDDDDVYQAAAVNTGSQEPETANAGADEALVEDCWVPDAPAVQPKTESVSVPNDIFANAMAQLDRGLDARQKLIDALKVQLSKSAALPKSVPARPPMETELPQTAAKFSTQPQAEATPQPVAAQVNQVHLSKSVALPKFVPAQPPVETELPQTAAKFPTQPQAEATPKPVAAQVDQVAQLFTVTKLEDIYRDVGEPPLADPDCTPAEPAPPREMTDTLKRPLSTANARQTGTWAASDRNSAEVVGEIPNTSQTGIALPTGSISIPVASDMHPVKRTRVAIADDAFLLEQRKAEMLRNLALGAPSETSTYSGGRGAAIQGASAQIPSALSSTPAVSSTADAVPSAPLGGVSPGAGVVPNAGASIPPCPPNATPEQYEAYRQKCWQQYFEYTSVWQKYMEKQKNLGARGAQPKASNVPGAPQTQMPAPMPGFAGAAHVPRNLSQLQPVAAPAHPPTSVPGAGFSLAPRMPLTAMGGGHVVPRPPLPPESVHRKEKDIHSELLGLV